MKNPIRSITIVGGGTAGWITAGTIAAAHQSKDGPGLNIHLIESPNLPTIGVGEGTWPTMRSTLQNMGISESDFFKECDVSFKQASKFAKWVTGEEDDFYYHPFTLPENFHSVNLAPFWLDSDRKSSFAEATCHQVELCEKNLAPKLITTPEYSGTANYAYHLNAGKFSEFLKKHCTEKLGVKLILDDVVAVRNAENGDIASAITKKHGEILGDLFIDCTGFKSLLIGEHFGVDFIDKNHILPIDTALAVQVPYESEDTPIIPYTLSTAQSNGWIWDIGLTSRRGVGHVFSSAHTDEEKAADELRAYLRPRVADIDTYEFRKIGIRSGHREKFWHNNCVAIGLSAGFLEPLEASAIVLIELSAQMIANQLPANRDAMNVVAKRFNQTFRYRWDRIIDFLKLHYILSQRTDSQFWVDVRAPETVPDSLNELLEFWRYQYPWNDDFTDKAEVFPSASYQYVLYGMGFETDLSYKDYSRTNPSDAVAAFNRVQQTLQKIVPHLPTTRDLLQKINQHGMKSI